MNPVILQLFDRVCTDIFVPHLIFHLLRQFIQHLIFQLLRVWFVLVVFHKLQIIPLLDAALLVHEPLLVRVQEFQQWEVVVLAESDHDDGDGQEAGLHDGLHGLLDVVELAVGEHQEDELVERGRILHFGVQLLEQRRDQVGRAEHLPVALQELALVAQHPAHVLGPLAPVDLHAVRGLLLVRQSESVHGHYFVWILIYQDWDNVLQGFFILVVHSVLYWVQTFNVIFISVLFWKIDAYHQLYIQTCFDEINLRIYFLNIPIFNNNWTVIII